MIKTDNFIKSMLDKSVIDDYAIADNGYDIQYKGNIVSVRMNGNGGALIYNGKTQKVSEIQSARLDDVLHRYIAQSLFGTQTKEGTRGMECKNVVFVPTKVIQNNVIFEDADGRKFTVNGSTPKAVLSYYKLASEVNADDCIMLLNGFTVYDRPTNVIKSNHESEEIEVQLLKCSADYEDYAVSPKSECINSVGQTIVGNFLCSSADKANYISFEEDEVRVFSNMGKMKRGITSSTMRSKDKYTVNALKTLSSSRKIVQNYLDKKYPNGLSLSAMNYVVGYEATSIMNSAKRESNFEYVALFNDYVRKGEKIMFRLDSNKSLFSAISVDGKSVAKFRCIPNLSAIKNSLLKNGYMLTELESGLEFKTTDSEITAILSNCKNFTPIAEDVMNKPNEINRVIGSECKKLLATYGIDDKNGVFSSITQFIIN